MRSSRTEYDLLDPRETAAQIASDATTLVRTPESGTTREETVKAAGAQHTAPVWASRLDREAASDHAPDLLTQDLYARPTLRRSTREPAKHRVEASIWPAACRGSLCGQTRPRRMGHVTNGGGTSLARSGSPASESHPPAGAERHDGGKMRAAVRLGGSCHGAGIVLTHLYTRQKTTI